MNQVYVMYEYLPNKLSRVFRHYLYTLIKKTLDRSIGWMPSEFNSWGRKQFLKLFTDLYNRNYLKNDDHFIPFNW